MTVSSPKNYSGKEEIVIELGTDGTCTKVAEFLNLRSKVDAHVLE